MSGQAELVARIADPSTLEVDRNAAERELCVSLAPRIRLYGLRHLRDDAAAADLVQDALLVVLRAAREGRIDDPAHVERFALGTCRHWVSHARRAERRDRALETAVLPLDREALPPAFSRIDADRLADCLGKVGARERRVVLLTFQEDRTADEIATEIGTSPGNVRVLRHRAMAALQRCVDGVTP